MSSDRNGAACGRYGWSGRVTRGILTMLWAVPLLAQFDPESAKAVIYIPQLADGGNDIQRWQTTLQILNASTVDSECSLEFLSPSAQPLAMDFGSGASATATISIPAGGRVTLRSNGSNRETRTGWATGYCTYPVTVNILFRLIDRGRESVEIAAGAATPSSLYRAAANRDLGIAIANVSATEDLRVSVTALDERGGALGVREVSICPRCQVTGNLGTWMPDLPVSYEGTALIESSSSRTAFAAWALHAEKGLLVSLPNGSLSWPVSHADRIRESWSKVLKHAISLFPEAKLDEAKLIISEERIINATARRTHEVTINLALAQLISDSPSELAAVIAHELAHLVQFRRGGTIYSQPNVELDADAVATVLLLVSGHDPYASAGVLGKLMMAMGRANLVAQTYDDIIQPHRSFVRRVGVQMDLLDSVCKLPKFMSACANYKQYIHPNFPTALPLGIPKEDGLPAAK